MNSLTVFKQASVQSQLGKFIELLNKILGNAGSFSLKVGDFIKQLMSSESSTAIKFAKSLKNAIGSQETISPRTLFNQLLLFMKENPAPGATAITKFKEGADLIPVYKEFSDFFQIIFYIVYYTTVKPLSYLCALISIAWDYKHIPEVQVFMVVLLMFVIGIVTSKKKPVVTGVRISPASSSKSTPKTPSPKSSPKTPPAPVKKPVAPAIMLPQGSLPPAGLPVTRDNLRLLAEALRKESGLIDTKRTRSPTKSQSSVRTVMTTMTEKEKSPEQLPHMVQCKHIKRNGERCDKKTKSTTHLCYSHKNDARKKGLIPQGKYREIQRIWTIAE